MVEELETPSKVAGQSALITCSRSDWHRTPFRWRNLWPGRRHYRTRFGCTRWRRNLPEVHRLRLHSYHRLGPLRAIRTGPCWSEDDYVPGSLRGGPSRVVHCTRTPEPEHRDVAACSSVATLGSADPSRSDPAWARVDHRAFLRA